MVGLLPIVLLVQSVLESAYGARRRVPMELFNMGLYGNSHWNQLC